ncbi:MAG: TonB-dependent receptor [Bacteroidales bacterium]|nr:TonB-dependent receptor [Bacteroidales bacterium]
MQRFIRLTTTILSFFILVSLSTTIQAQEAAVRGFVYEASNGEPVIFCNVYLQGTTYGASTDINGYFSITKVPAGQYMLLVTFLGYDTLRQEIVLKPNDVLNRKFNLVESSVSLETVNVTAEKIEARTETKTSVVNITPKILKKIPSIGGQADLAQYLQVVPGVVFTGDQGGQLYIRGGSPIQNKVLLDGMIVYNPFHSIGLFSVFDTDMIRNAEVFTGGFSADYGGRVSSIMDITTRDGNKNQLSGKVGASTFGAKLLLEGPLSRAKVENGSSSSFIFSVKNSYLEQTSKSLYSYVDEDGLPFNFLDLYGKISINAANGSKINFFGFSFDDKVNNYKSLSDFGWSSVGGGSNFLIIPGKSPVLIEGNLAYSSYKATLSEASAPERFSSINGFNMGFHFTYFLGKDLVKYGIELLGFKTEFDFTNGVGRNINQTENTTELAGYVRYKGNFGKLLFEPSFRVQWYASLGNISPEPRLSVKYLVNDWFRIKLATGMYSQNLIAANSDRDVVNLFYGFLSGPDNLPNRFDGKEVTHKLQKANHYILGTEIDLTNRINLNIEGYLKDFNQLTNLNRNKLFNENTAPANTPDIYKKDFIIEKGKAYGGDIALKYEDKKWYIWSVYSLGFVTKEYEKRPGELISYRPHYDRRHNVNLLISYTAGDRRQWEFGARWNYGSGFPFTQVQGYYEHLNFGQGVNTDYTNANGNLGILYGDLNEGELPSYHRLDFDIKRRFFFSERTQLEVNVSVTNMYNRENVFYVDQITSDVIRQLPLMPSFGMTLSF